jgi:alpha-L-fucosidase 2
MKFIGTAAACLLVLALPPARAANLKGIEYARSGGVLLKMDARIPAGDGPFPAAILVHGGAWVTGSLRFDITPLFKPLANAGFACFSVSYRLARKPPLRGSFIDTGKIGDGIEDVQRAVNFVRDHAAEFNIDPNRIVLIGESAGAQLASMAAIRGAAVKAVVAFYCPSDLVAIARPRGFFNGVAARVAWGNVQQLGLRDLSPLASVRPGMPPFLFIHGTLDHVVPFEQSTSMCNVMQSVGSNCEVIAVKGGLHGIQLWEVFRKTSYKRQMLDWLARTVG